MNIQSLFDNMAQQSNEKLARSLLDPSGREVLWPVVFAGVKNIVKTSHLNNDTLKCIKSWLKSNDSQLQIPLLGLTVGFPWPCCELPDAHVKCFNAQFLQRFVESCHM